MKKRLLFLFLVCILFISSCEVQQSPGKTSQKASKSVEYKFEINRLDLDPKQDGWNVLEQEVLEFVTEEHPDKLREIEEYFNLPIWEEYKEYSHESPKGNWESFLEEIGGEETMWEWPVCTGCSGDIGYCSSVCMGGSWTYDLETNKCSKWEITINFSF